MLGDCLGAAYWMPHFEGAKMGKHSLLLVDDDLELATMLREFVLGEGYCMLHASSGELALQMLSENKIDMALLDVMMPGLSGFEVLTRLRTRSDIPVLMLTARGEEGDRIQGLDLGADDYLSKPFNPRELMARIRAILRRMEKTHQAREEPLEIGPLMLNAADLVVMNAGQSVRLTAAEFAVLHTLALSAGQVQSRAVLTEKALGRSLEAYDRSVDTHVANIRRKLALTPDASLEIRSVRNAGYVLVAGKGSS
jgi:DNA-binding response OmpR family regulator